MRRVAVVLLVLLSGTAQAQDMDLSQLLIDGEGWKRAVKEVNDASSLATDTAGSVWVVRPKELSRVMPDGKVVTYSRIDQELVQWLQKWNVKLDGPPPVQLSDEVGKVILTLRGQKAGGLATAGGWEYRSDPKTGISLSSPSKPWLLKTPAVKSRVTAAPPPGEEFSRLAASPDGGTLVAAGSGGRHVYSFRIEEDRHRLRRQGP
jgi:hypothetical protein